MQKIRTKRNSIIEHKQSVHYTNTPQNMKFSIKDFFSKCDQIHWKLRIWSHLLKKYLMENFIFRAVKVYVLIEIHRKKYIYINI